MLSDPWFYLIAWLLLAIGMFAGMLLQAVFSSNEERYRRILSDVVTKRY